MWLEPVTLQAQRVRLEPLTLAHHPALCTAGLHPSLWQWTTTAVRDENDMRVYIETALRSQREGTALPFVTVDTASRAVIGSTRFANADYANRRVEIGWTWITPAFQRTPANTEAKYLMLRHAFEVLGCHRVELKTDALNERSRRAMLRLGAREEGTLRRHMVAQGGRLRDTVYYGIILEEWPEVRQRLEAWIARPYSPRP
jgi:RimJ/RimL family protein N-acetyltransferase